MQRGLLSFLVFFLGILFCNCVFTPDDKRGPVLVSSVPANKDVHVDIFSPIIFHFDEPVILRKNVRIEQAVQTNFLFDLLYDNGDSALGLRLNGISLYQGKFMIPDQEYTIRLTSDIMDKHGNSLDDTTISFHTLTYTNGLDTTARGADKACWLLNFNACDTHVLAVNPPETIGVAVTLKKHWDIELGEYVQLRCRVLWNDIPDTSNIRIISDPYQPETLWVAAPVAGNYWVLVEILRTQPPDLFYRFQVF